MKTCQSCGVPQADMPAICPICGFDSGLFELYTPTTQETVVADSVEPTIALLTLEVLRLRGKLEKIRAALDG